MKMVIPLLALFAMNGCEPAAPRDPVSTPLAVSDAGGVTADRFEVRHWGSFEAGYDNAKRDILVITDRQTGTDYLAVTDCSLVKIIEAEREADAVAAKIAVDAATAIGSQ